MQKRSIASNLKIRGTRSVPKYLKNCISNFSLNNWALATEQKYEEFTNEVSKFRSIARLHKQSCESRKLCFLRIHRFAKQICVNNYECEHKRIAWFKIQGCKRPWTIFSQKHTLWVSFFFSRSSIYIFCICVQLLPPSCTMFCFLSVWVLSCIQGKCL